MESSQSPQVHEGSKKPTTYLVILFSFVTAVNLAVLGNWIWSDFSNDKSPPFLDVLITLGMFVCGIAFVCMPAACFMTATRLNQSRYFFVICTCEVGFAVGLGLMCLPTDFRSGGNLAALTPMDRLGNLLVGSWFGLHVGIVFGSYVYPVYVRVRANR
jgi:hypothetical protein